MRITVKQEDIGILPSHGYLQVRVPDALWEFGTVRLAVGGRRFAMLLTGRGWVGRFPEIRLEPARHEFEEIVTAIQASDVADIDGLKRLRS
jgi:hypothetical protein